ncbi:MAG: hypothetical protein COC10_07625 [Sphingobium sp.]|nr:MAG: hypothetical protein COC10_07625 [Sphingobium sp.]
MSRLLHETGEALYGPQWQSPLSRDLGCNVRTIQRWAAGVNDPPDGIWIDLHRLTQERAMMLDALSDRLKTEGAPGIKGPTD